MTKILSVMLHTSETIHCIIVIYGTHLQNGNISRSSFHFFKILIFQVVSGVKGQKMVQNDKKLCLLCSISLKPYIVWLTFMVHICKRISLGFVFIFFRILMFQAVKGVKGQKMVQHDKKFGLLCYISQEPYMVWFSFMVHMCKRISLGFFFIFSKFWFFRLLKG